MPNQTTEEQIQTLQEECRVLEGQIRALDYEQDAATQRYQRIEEMCEERARVARVHERRTERALRRARSPRCEVLLFNRGANDEAHALYREARRQRDVVSDACNDLYSRSNDLRGTLNAKQNRLSRLVCGPNGGSRALRQPNLCITVPPELAQAITQARAERWYASEDDDIAPHVGEDPEQL